VLGFMASMFATSSVSKPAQPHRGGEDVSARVIVVVHLLPPGPQSRERFGCDLFGGGHIEGHQSACPHDPRVPLAEEPLEALTVGHHTVLSRT